MVTGAHTVQDQRLDYPGNRTFSMKSSLSLFIRLEALPVFRHGSEAARICDEALSVSGPTDPRIAKLIQSDQNAQMAYHIHKALGFALEVS